MASTMFPKDLIRADLKRTHSKILRMRKFDAIWRIRCQPFYGEDKRTGSKVKIRTPMGYVKTDGTHS